jgi:hypothetical protein
MRGECAVAIYNKSDAAVSMSVEWSELEWPEEGARVRNLWTHAELGIVNGGYSAKVAAHGTEVIRLSPTNPALSAKLEAKAAEPDMRVQQGRSAAIVSIRSVGPYALAILDMRGRAVFRASGTAPACHAVSRHAMPPGVYVVRLVADGEQAVGMVAR